MIQKNYLGADIPKLGFGMMRLPMNGDVIDMEQVNRMVDRFIASGFTYFDTAWGYLDGHSEGAVRQAVVERHPRQSVQIATKFPIWAIEKQDDVQRVFDTQLERTGAGYFDYYLIHAISADKLEALDRYGVWDFVMEMKRKGLIRHAGFSFHDTAKCLDEILTAHPEVEFVQLQINYADWDNDRIEAGACYEVCVKHGKPVIVMEPVKGGALADLPEGPQNVLKAVNPDDSCASWAIRYCASLDYVITVLSGMSTEAQMEDNLKTMKDFQPLSAAEREAVDQVVEILKNAPTIPCTACKYCVENCPQNINIPELISVYNKNVTFGYNQGTQVDYDVRVKERGRAGDCVRCGTCEGRCPQHIEIIRHLEAISGVFDR